MIRWWIPLVLIFSWVLFIGGLLIYLKENRKEVCGKVISKVKNTDGIYSTYHLELDLGGGSKVIYECSKHQYDNIVVDLEEPRIFCYD